MIYQFENECSCFVDNHLLNKILFVSDSDSLVSLLVTVIIAMCIFFFGMLLAFTILATVPPNIKFYDMSWILIKCEFILGVIFSSMVSILVISKSKMKHQPISKWDPVIRKRRQYIWDDTLNKYVNSYDPVDTVITVSN